MSPQAGMLLIGAIVVMLVLGQQKKAATSSGAQQTAGILSQINGLFKTILSSGQNQPSGGSSGGKPPAPPVTSGMQQTSPGAKDAGNVSPDTGTVNTQTLQEQFDGLVASGSSPEQAATYLNMTQVQQEEAIANSSELSTDQQVALLGAMGISSTQIADDLNIPQSDVAQYYSDTSYGGDASVLGVSSDASATLEDPGLGYDPSTVASDFYDAGGGESGDSGGDYSG